MKNIEDDIELSKDMRFICESVRLFIFNEVTSEERIQEMALIGIKNLDTGGIIIHPFSDFIRKYWGKKSFNAQRNRVYHLIAFLNFIGIEYIHIYKIKSFYEVDIEIGNDFLDHMAKKNSKAAVDGCERTLVYFYKYLADQNLLTKVDKKLFNIQGISSRYGRMNKTIMSPFNYTIQPKQSNPEHTMHHIPMELISIFLQVAIEYTPDIAFGVYTGIFGGLRYSETANTTRSAVTVLGAYGEYGFIIDTLQNNLSLDLEVNAAGHVKRERLQMVLPLGKFGAELYKRHLNTYCKDNSNILFYDKNGNQMTAPTYRRRFNKLKKIFLSLLEKSDVTELQSYANTLSTKKWSTHIGRGIFSNMVSDSSDNLGQIALLRGDKTFEAAIKYLSDSAPTRKKLEVILNSMYKDMGKEEGNWKTVRDYTKQKN